jgi:hypothetical protein
MGCSRPLFYTPIFSHSHLLFKGLGGSDLCRTEEAETLSQYSTGHSALNEIHLPVDDVALARQFVQGLEGESLALPNCLKRQRVIG